MRAGPRRRTAGALAPLLAAMLCPSCTWYPWTPDVEPPPPSEAGRPAARPIAPGEPAVDALDCPAGECHDRFRVEIGRAGVLHAVVRTLAEEAGVEARVVLEGPEGVVAETSGGPEHAFLTIGVPVGPGVYTVLVESLGGRFRYEVGVRLEPAGS